MDTRSDQEDILHNDDERRRRRKCCYNGLRITLGALLLGWLAALGVFLWLHLARHQSGAVLGLAYSIIGVTIFGVAFCTVCAVGWCRYRV